MEIEVKGEEVFLYESKASAVRRDVCCHFRHISVYACVRQLEVLKDLLPKAPHSHAGESFLLETPCRFLFLSDSQQFCLMIWIIAVYDSM